LGYFKSRHLFSKKCLNGFSGGTFVAGELNKRDGSFTEFFIFPRNNAGLGDAFIFKKMALNFLRLDIFSTGDELIILPSENRQPALFDLSQIMRIEPTVFRQG